MSSRWQENDLILRAEEGVGGAGRAQGWGTETQVCRAAASREGGHGKGCDILSHPATKSKSEEPRGGEGRRSLFPWAPTQSHSEAVMPDSVLLTRPIAI